MFMSTNEGMRMVRQQAHIRPFRQPREFGLCLFKIPPWIFEQGQTPTRQLFRLQPVNTTKSIDNVKDNAGLKGKKNHLRLRRDGN
jgi:hypothetical protein